MNEHVDKNQRAAQPPAWPAYLVVLAALVIAISAWVSGTRSLQVPTMLVALLTLFVAFMSYISQHRGETIMRETLRLQGNMDHRDLDERRSRATTAMHELKRLVHSGCNILQSTPASPEIMALVTSGWHGAVSKLPDCEFKQRAVDVFTHLVTPPTGMIQSSMEVSHRQALEVLCSEMTEGLVAGCKKAISEMK